MSFLIFYNSTYLLSNILLMEKKQIIHTMKNIIIGLTNNIIFHGNGIDNSIFENFKLKIFLDISVGISINSALYLILFIL